MRKVTKLEVVRSKPPYRIVRGQVPKGPFWWVQEFRNGRWCNPKGANGGPLGSLGSAEALLKRLP